MIGSKQQTHFWYFSNVYIITPVSDLFRRCMRELAYLCCPVDTTENIGRRQTEINCSKVIELRPVLKGVFWVIVSIAVPVAIGQLL